MELKEIMKQFGVETGLTQLLPDGDGIYRLEIDGRVVSLAESAQGRMLVVWAALGELPSDGRETLYRLLLEEMFMAQGTAGSSFTLEPNNDTLFLQRTDALQAMDYDDFKAMFEKFLNLGDLWAKLIADFSPLTSELIQERKRTESKIMRFGSGAFIQA